MEKEDALIEALKNQTAAIEMLSVSILALTESLREMLIEDDDEEEGEQPTYLNGDSIKR